MAKLIKISAISLLSFSFFGQCTAEERWFRTWTDRTGEFTTKAILLGVEGGNVWLEKQSGQRIRVAIDRLSHVDKALANNHRQLPHLNDADSTSNFVGFDNRDPGEKVKLQMEVIENSEPKDGRRMKVVDGAESTPHLNQMVSPEPEAVLEQITMPELDSTVQAVCSEPMIVTGPILSCCPCPTAIECPPASNCCISHPRKRRLFAKCK